MWAAPLHFLDESATRRSLRDSSLHRLKKLGKSSRGQDRHACLYYSTTDQRSQAQPRERDQSDECRKIYSPTSKGLEGYVPMYWNADAARHLFKHVSEWTSLERKRWCIPSRLSVAKFIAEDVRDFAIQKGVLSPRNAADSTLSTYAVYYTEHWLKDTAELNVLTIDTLARYIRLDRKRRLVKSKHSICSGLNISLAVVSWSCVVSLILSKYFQSCKKT
ncbi:hypothetical protein GQ600_23877 [Phytophthora cactorum]|nr:hypothetical protein GQ600_23877 [Phytophthora cactorum]